MAKLHTRLSWHPSSPAPFESAWILFLKICVLNEITPHNLMRLIQTEVSKKRKINALDITDSSWIDFEKLSGLLGVREETLRNCFPDQLGIKGPNSGYKVRICPQCLDLNYHCVLFDLPFVQSCPWHRVPLISSCSECSAPVKGARLTKPYDLLLCCPGCREILVDFVSDYEVTKVPSHLADRIHIQCSELLDWCKTAMSRYSPHHELPYRYEPEPFGIYYSVILDVADKPPLSWEIARKKSRFSLIRWKAENRSVPLDLLKSYKSLRRHLFNKFVRRYRGCFNNILLCNGYAISFNVDKVAKPALAFLLWRMSIEGRNLSELDQRTRRRLTLNTPDLQSFVTEVDDDFVLNWCYAQYFGIYQKLSTLKDSKYYLFLMGNLYSQEPLVWFGKRSVPSQAILFPNISKYLDEEVVKGSRGSSNFFFHQVAQVVDDKELSLFPTYSKVLAILHKESEVQQSIDEKCLNLVETTWL